MEVGNLGTNCYIAYCEDTLQAFVIDPGDDATRIIKTINEKRLKVSAIINTHGHFDHVMANTRLKDATQAPIWIHAGDAEMLTSGSKNLSSFMGPGITCGSADRELSEGDVLTAGSVTFKVLHTPGHTPGGICLLAEDVVIVGDTLFAESIGRTDFPGGSYSQLINSIKTKLMTLGDEYKVFPGHGPATTIGWERQRNPFIQ